MLDKELIYLDLEAKDRRFVIPVVRYIVRKRICKE